MAGVSGAGANSTGTYPSFSFSSGSVGGNFSGYSPPQLLKSNFGPDSGQSVPYSSNTGGTTTPPSLSGPASAGITSGPTSMPVVSFGYTASGGSLGSGASMIGSTVSISV